MKSVKLLFCISALIFCISNHSYSQKKNNTTAIPSGFARFESLGYNPFILDAAVDINRNPAWGGIYENYVFGDIGKYSNSNFNKDSAYRLRDQYAGANFRLGKQWDLGFILNRPEGQLYTGSMSSELTTWGLEGPVFPIEALATYSSSSVIVSLAPYYAGWSQETTLNDYSLDKSSNVFGGSLGFIFKTRNVSSWSEATVRLLTNSYKSTIDSAGTVNDVTVDNSGGLELNANYKGWYRLKNSVVNLVPYVGFTLFSYDPQVILAGSSLGTSENKYWSFIAGIGVNFPIEDQGFFAGGLSGGYTSDEFTTADTILTADYKETNVILPMINLGLEWNLTDFLQGRVGYSRSIINRDNTGTLTTSSTVITVTEKGSYGSNPDQTITLGLGWQFDRFSLDGIIGEQLFTTGPNVISGKSSDLYGRLSMSYNFLK